MQQILQSLKSGETELADVPIPAVTPRALVVEARASVISAGTERMLVEFGRGSLLEKARQQPDRVKEVLRKIRTDGLGSGSRPFRCGSIDQPASSRLRALTRSEECLR